jgi:hypothetical protein
VEISDCRGYFWWSSFSVQMEARKRQRRRSEKIQFYRRSENKINYDIKTNKQSDGKESKQLVKWQSVAILIW